MEHINEIVNKIHELDAKNAYRETIDYIYIFFDEQLVKNNFKICEMVLKNLNVNKLSIDALLAVLTITIRVDLNGRKDFYKKVATKLQTQKPIEAQLLLCGLE